MRDPHRTRQVQRQPHRRRGGRPPGRGLRAEPHGGAGASTASCSAGRRRRRQRRRRRRRRLRPSQLHRRRAPPASPPRPRIAFDGATAVVEVANTCGLHTLPGGHSWPRWPPPAGASAKRSCSRCSSTRPGSSWRWAAAPAPTAEWACSPPSGYGFRDARGRQLPRQRQVPGADPHRRPRPGSPNSTAPNSSSPATSTTRCSGPTARRRSSGPKRAPTAGQVAALDAGLAHLVAALTAAGFDGRRGSSAAARRAPGAPAGSASPACCWAPGRSPAPTTSWTCSISNTPQGRCDLVITGEGRIDDQTLAGKLPAAVARRSGTRPIIAVAGRSLLPRERWSELALTRVYTLAEYTDQDSSKDPGLSAALLQRIGKDIAASLL